MTQFEASMTALTLRSGLRLKNRMIFTAMGIDLADAQGCFTDTLADFYTDIANGEVAAAILANSSVSEHSRLHEGGLVLTSGAQRDALRKFTAPLIERQCAPIVQLQHYGPQGSTHLTGAPLLVPSDDMAETAPNSPAQPRRVMTLDDIRQVVAQFVASAILAESAGASGVQIQAGNGYLLSSFLSPFSNRRTDAYGGNIDGRSRMLREIVTALRSALDAGTSVSVRLNVSDGVENGISPDDVRSCIAMLADADVDFIELTYGVRRSFYRLLSPTGTFVEDLRRHIQTVTGYSPIPIAFAGGTGSLDQAEHMLQAQICDLVGMSRALFADNDLIPKTLSGNSAQIDRCLFDGNCFRDKSNPLADRVYCCVSKKYPRPKHITYQGNI